MDGWTALLLLSTMPHGLTAACSQTTPRSFLPWQQPAPNQEGSTGSRPSTHPNQPDRTCQVGVPSPSGVGHLDLHHRHHPRQLQLAHRPSEGVGGPLLPSGHQHPLGLRQALQHLRGGQGARSTGRGAGRRGPTQAQPVPWKGSWGGPSAAALIRLPLLPFEILASTGSGRPHLLWVAERLVGRDAKQPFGLHVSQLDNICIARTA